MTSKEKAKELVDKYYNFGDQEFDYSKEFALIAVDTIIEQDEKIIVSHKISSYKSAEDFNQNLKHIQNELDSYVLSRYSYWQAVKQEIEKL